MKRRYAFLSIIILLCCNTALTGFADTLTAAAGSQPEGTHPAGLTAFLQQRPDYTLMAENRGRALLLNKQNLAVAVIDTATGTVFGESVMNGRQGNNTVKNLQKSAVQVTYLADTGQRNIGTLHTMDSYSFCTELKGFEIREIPHGFELDLTLGSNALCIDDLPKMIPVEKYNELLLPYFSSKNDKNFREQYRVVKDKYWIRVKDKDMGDMMIAYLHNILFEKGKYTQDDLIADNAVYGYVPENANPRISLTLRYELDGESLVLTIPLQAVQGNHQIQMIEPAPYFLSSGTEDSGYLFVPDGSGALIRFNNGKNSAAAYKEQVFGADILKDVHKYRAQTFDITMPVYGIKKNDHAVLAIIEKGAELAEIFADVSGHSDEFNRIASRFILRDIENINLLGNSSATTARWPEDVYTGDIVLRYTFLSGSTAHYTGMAKCYQQYLLDRGQIAKHPPEPAAPFFAECMGALRKLKFFLGVGYQSTICATTINQGEKIYQTLRNGGAQNIKFIFSGLYAGGVKNESLKKMRLNSGMGSAEDFAQLQKTVSESGGMLFPSIYTANVFGSKRFSRLSDAPRRQSGEPAGRVLFLENMMLSMNLRYPAFYVSPYRIPSYTETVKQNLAAWTTGGVALRDLGNTLIPDYRRKKHLSRIHAMPVFQDALQSLAESYPLMLSNPNSYALGAASYINDLPSSHNGYAILDAAVPFVQLVLDGCLPYSATAWNGKAAAGLTKPLLHAIETKSSPYFLFTFQKETVFHNILDRDLAETFSTYHEDWTETAAAVYKQYNAFYMKVKHSQIIDHEILDGDLRLIRYDNGITVYVNYSSAERQLDGIRIPAQGYIIKGDKL
ncbi:MAG: DUF5696 domain-containing protein [Treponema sp.]